MAKTKNKSAHARLIRQFKKNALGPWSRDTLALVQRIDETREGGSLEQISGCPLLADSLLSFRESMVLTGIQARAYGEMSKCTMFPDVMAAWETNPKEVELSPDAGFYFDFYEDEFEWVSLDGLSRFFPGCLLVDASNFGWDCFYVCEEVSGLFVFPSYDEDEGLPMLRCLALMGKDVYDVLPTEIYLTGSTLGEARQYTAAKQKRLRTLAWVDDEKRDFLESHEQMVRRFDADQDELDWMLDRLLGMLLSPDFVVEETAVGGVCHIKLRTAFEVQDEATGRVLAEELLVRELDGLPADAEPAELPAPIDPSGPPEPELSDSPDSSEEPEPSVAEPEPAIPMVALDEALRLQEALELLQGRYEQLLKRSEADKAMFLHNLHESRARCRSLEAENSGLKARAALMDELDFPKTPLGAVELAQKAFPDRLLFLDQALESAAEFDGRPASEVWSLLRSMATVLHPLVFQGAEGDIVDAYQSKASFELALRDAKMVKKNPKAAKRRTVRYEGREEDMTAHVKGKSDKPGEALRVHFFADYRKKVLVIGYCGDHLPTWW